MPTYDNLSRITCAASIALLLLGAACDSDPASGTQVGDAGDTDRTTRPDARDISTNSDVSNATDAVSGLDCDGDECPPIECTPEQTVGCQDGMLLFCNADGDGYNTASCLDGEYCYDGECRPILPNVLLLVDTSSSMNWTPGGTQPNECGASCWPWTYPACDNNPAGPSTRLGRVKAVLTEILASDAATDVRIALQRFPQRIYTALPPDCDGGYWTGNSQMQGDENYHTLSRTWLGQHLSEIVVFPFPVEGETVLASFAQWFDNQDVLVETATTCSVNEECDGTPCLGGHCMAFTNPELWGMGLTPFGKSLFYSGEYMRHFVVVEGRACETTADCGSANYTCVDGTCHDPFGHCRPNVVIAFTDGEETEHFYTDDFFHPRVQAKRLHYGLGCEFDADCGDEATCVDGVCRPPAGLIDETQLVCDANDVPCTGNEQCGGFRCRPTRLDFIDPAGEDRIEDAAGNPISLTIHVVDASNVPDANNLVAAYGGGQHFSVDLDDPDAVFDIFEALLDDAKVIIECLAQ